MPVTKTALREMRAAERKRVQNQGARSEVKTRVSKARKVIASGDAQAANEAVDIAISTLDKAAKKGVIHANAAARGKARLMNRLHKASETTE